MYGDTTSNLKTRHLQKHLATQEQDNSLYIAPALLNGFEFLYAYPQIKHFIDYKILTINLLLSFF